MFQSPLAPSFDVRSRPSYQIRVRATTYLWGSATITADATFSKPLLLHIRNNVFGDVVHLFTQSAGGTDGLGALRPGEAYTIAIQGMSGVYATCASESAVDCLIESSH
jgi:hypothetical protein